MMSQPLIMDTIPPSRCGINPNAAPKSDAFRRIVKAAINRSINREIKTARIDSVKLLQEEKRR